MRVFRTLADFTAWLLPSKNKRLQYKDLCSYLDLRDDLKRAKENYEIILSRLKNKTDKIRVVFLVRENQKWTYQSIYDEFAKSDKFEPLVLVSLLEICHIGKDKTRNNLEENYNFFKSRNMNVDYAYKDGEYIELEEFHPDIVFYDQPWDLPQIHTPFSVSKYALTCYCPYAYELTDSREHYLIQFHGFLYKFFVSSESHLKIYESYLRGNSRNCFVAGYPKLDEYFSPPKSKGMWKNNEKFKIIYAPHHSFEKNGLRLATFKENGQFILDFAKQHPETEWIFKPHPRFKYALLKNKIMNESEINDYYNEWKKIGSVYDEGDYIDIFRSSNLLVTDCVSFIAEYLPTKLPIIRLSNSSPAKFNEIGSLMKKACYSVCSESEFQNAFNKLITEKNVNKESCPAEIFSSILGTKKSSARIMECLMNGILES